MKHSDNSVHSEESKRWTHSWKLCFIVFLMSAHLKRTHKPGGSSSKQSRSICGSAVKPPPTVFCSCLPSTSQWHSNRTVGLLPNEWNPHLHWDHLGSMCFSNRTIFRQVDPIKGSDSDAASLDWHVQPMYEWHDGVLRFNYFTGSPFHETNHDFKS